jgi:hypothetical protein
MVYGPPGRSPRNATEPELEVFFEAVELVGSNVTEAEAPEIGFPLLSRTVRLISDVSS